METFDLYKDMEIPKWAGFNETFEDKPYIQKQQVYNWNGENKTWEDWAPVVARYYAIISQVDDAVGRVINKLKEIGAWENTMIVFILPLSLDILEKYQIVNMQNYMNWTIHIVQMIQLVKQA